MKSPRTTHGFTLVEVIMALALLSVLMAFIANFFIEQNHFTNAQQVREEVQANVQAAVELVTEDLRNAGSFGVPAVGLPIAPDVALIGVDGGTQPDRVRTRYQRYSYGTGTSAGTYSEVDVTYKIKNDAQGVPTLYRSQTAPGATTGCRMDPTATDGSDCVPAIQNIVAFNLQYKVRRACMPTTGGSSLIYVEKTFDQPSGTDNFGGLCLTTQPFTAADVYRVEVKVIGRAPLPQATAGTSLTAGGQTVPRLAKFTYKELEFTFDTPSL